MTNANTVAFITGANRGLGFETARELGQAGITVVLGSRDQAKGEQAAKALLELGVEAAVLQFDAAQPKDAQRAFDYFQKNYGRLDILVNNAGVFIEPFFVNTSASVSEQTLRETFDTNFFAVVRLTQTLLPLIEKSAAGRIVNLSSVLGSLTVHSLPESPIEGMKAFAYDASKTALNAFTVHLAHHLRGTKIKVNSAHPGWVKTDMGGEQAQMEVAEGGKTSALLATLDENGPSGSFIHLQETLPW